MKTILLELQEIRENAEAVLFSVDSLVAYIKSQTGSELRTHQRTHTPEIVPPHQPPQNS